MYRSNIQRINSNMVSCWVGALASSVVCHRPFVGTAVCVQVSLGRRICLNSFKLVGCTGFADLGLGVNLGLVPLVDGRGWEPLLESCRGWEASFTGRAGSNGYSWSRGDTPAPSESRILAARGCAVDWQCRTAPGVVGCPVVPAHDPAPVCLRVAMELECLGWSQTVGLALPEGEPEDPGGAKLSSWLTPGLLLPQNWGLACPFCPLQLVCATQGSVLVPFLVPAKAWSWSYSLSRQRPILLLLWASLGALSSSSGSWRSSVTQSVLAWTPGEYWECGWLWWMHKG